MNGVTAYVFSSLHAISNLCMCPTNMYRLLFLERLQVTFVLLDKMSII